MTPATPAPKPAFSLIPYAIIGTFVLFAGYIGWFVQRAMRSDVNLVSADYYQQELHYQQRIAAEARTAALPTPVAFERDGASLGVQLPAALVAAIHAAPEALPLTGTLHFVRPADARHDLTIPFAPDATGRQLLAIGHLRPGRWLLELDFTAAQQHYFVRYELDK